MLLLLLAQAHVIHVVDEATGRGVPLVELETVHKTRLYTDSAGVAVFDGPELLGREVYLHVRSDGYELPADGFGFRGARVKMEPKGRTTLKVKRLLAAERLYRVTGQGIYAESIKAGDAPPLKESNGGVLGQDTVQTIAWKGKLWWFWGDTERAAYPLGQFSTSGATSPMPDPSVGVELTYWVDDQGFSRKMIDVPNAEGPVWIDALMVLRDDHGTERLYAHYIVVKELGDVRRRGLCAWNEKTERFVPVFPFDVDEPLHPRGQPVREGEWLYFPSPYALVRVKADAASVSNPRRYEAFTCLKPGGRMSKDPPLDRVWGWKADTAPVDEKTQEELIKKGALKPEEAWFRLKSESGERVVAHMGTVCRNAHRKKWIAIFHQSWGKPSMLGEVWYAEADQPWGPFERGVKIVTHQKYSFYNVVQHPEFDQDGGRRVYFEGTYTKMFTNVETATPRYDYNQIMYRLDLDDPRLAWAQRR
ncbi:MAG TPA: hypothetical protein VF950_16460 [Planctomycetota bacterium]